MEGLNQKIMVLKTSPIYTRLKEICPWSRLLPISSISKQWSYYSNLKPAKQLKDDFEKEYGELISETLTSNLLTDHEKFNIIYNKINVRTLRPLCDRLGNLIKIGDIILCVMNGKIEACIITRLTKCGTVMYLPLSYVQWRYLHRNTNNLTPSLNIQSFEPNRFLIISKEELSDFEKEIFNHVCIKFNWVKQLCDDRARERALCI